MIPTPMPSIDQLPCPALVTDGEGNVRSVNHALLTLIGGDKQAWFAQPMERMFPKASRIFLQTHVWPMIFRSGQVREIRLQLLLHAGSDVPVFVNCQRSTHDGQDRFIWVLFVSIERARYEQELLESRQRAEAISAALAVSERFIRTVSDALPNMIAYWDPQLICQFVNQSAAQWFGHAPHDIVGATMASLLDDLAFTQLLPYAQRALAGVPQQFERATLRPDGSTGHVLADYIPDYDATGVVKGFFSVVTNITRLREADAAVRLSASVFEATTEGIMVTDTDATVVSVNPAFTALTGYAADEIVGQNARVLKSDKHEVGFFAAMFRSLKTDRFWRGEVWSRRKDGAVYLLQLSLSAICDDSDTVVRYVGVCSDITEKWVNQQRVRHMALHDGLTGLPNRTLLMERLDQLIAMWGRDARQIALLFLDLDEFKSVNDTLGHEMGDHVLTVVAQRLAGLLRNSDTVARLGGDEFVLLLDNPESHESIGVVGTRVIAALNEPIVLGHLTAQVGTSVGIAVFRGEGDSPYPLLKRADDAMYAAKAAGKNIVRFAA